MRRAIKGIDLGSLVVAGFVAGWMMYFIDHYFNGLFGLFGMFPGLNNPGWMIKHHIESIIFAIPFAWPFIYERLPGSGWLKGIVYGFLWWLFLLLILGWIAGALGAIPFQQMAPSSAAGVITAILLHVIWGFFLGILYNPPEEVIS